MAWTYRLNGVFSVAVEGNRINLVVERSPLAQYEALQLASALTSAGHEMSYRKAFGSEHDRMTEAPPVDSLFRG